MNGSIAAYAVKTTAQQLKNRETLAQSRSPGLVPGIKSDMVPEDESEARCQAIVEELGMEVRISYPSCPERRGYQTPDSSRYALD